MAVSVRLDRVSKDFGGARAVNAISLEIEPGELFFLLGPSGCGKTTLLRCIAGFYEPDEGSIALGGRDITRVPPHLRDTGMVFQSYALWPHMTVRENVAFGLEMRRVPRAEAAPRVEEALRMVKMEDRADARPNQLSGGQQQRVALARALVIHPQCLLLDEPLSNLDAKLRLEMRAEIRRICKEAGLTAIYVTHDQKEALSIADRLAVLNDGAIQQVGPPLEVYRRPASRFVAGFIGETNFLDGVVVDRRRAAASGTPDGMAVETPAGILVSTASEPGVGVGTTVTVSVRPEAIRFGPPPEGAANALRGQVHHTLYLGEVAQHLVTLNGGRDVTLKAFELNTQVVAREQAHERVMWVDPAEVVVLTR